jgi:hypothetical protein
MAYKAAGVANYSSAIFNFLPNIALDFFGAVQRDDSAAVQEALRGFVLPYLEIRNRRRVMPSALSRRGSPAWAGRRDPCGHHWWISRRRTRVTCRVFSLRSISSASRKAESRFAFA